MGKRGDEVKVGIMVAGTMAVLITTIFMMTQYNPFQPSNDEYRVYLQFAGGLDKDSVVRFGGIRRGKVTSVRLTSDSASAIEVAVSLRRGTPVRTDSVARLASLNALGENYLEISPGQKGAPLLKPGQVIQSEESPEFSELLAKIDRLAADAGKLVLDLNKNINRISDGADTLLANLNDVTGPKNRKSLSSILEGADGMVARTNDLIARNSPRIDGITTNIQSATEKLPPLVQRIDEATTRVNTLLEHLDGTITENRPQLKKDLEAIDLTLAEVRELMAGVSETLESNRGELDAMLESLRRSAENLQEFTNTIKQRPFSLVRVKAKPDRQVPKQ